MYGDKVESIFKKVKKDIEKHAAASKHYTL